MKNSIKDIETIFPDISYCNDNAAMIAMVGYLKYNNNDFSTLEKIAQARFKL